MNELRARKVAYTGLLLAPLALSFSPHLLRAGIDVHVPAQPGHMCKGDLTGPAIALPRGQLSFGSVQGQPALPLGPNEYVLTFDDGPFRPTTPSLLATLKRYCVEATFMMIGRRAAAQPDLVHDILADGHGIGSHSFDHADFGPMSPDQMQADITQGVDAVERAAWLHPRQGTTPRLFRIPGATGVPLTPPAEWMKFFRQQNLILAGYDISPQDWRHDPPKVSFQRMFNHFPDRGVIVMHDAQPPTLDLLPMVLDELRRRHAKIASLDLKNGSEPRIAGQD